MSKSKTKTVSAAVELSAETLCACGVSFAEHDPMVRQTFAAYERTFTVHTMDRRSPARDADRSAEMHARFIANAVFEDAGEAESTRDARISAALAHAAEFGPMPAAMLAAGRAAHSGSRYTAESSALAEMQRAGMTRESAGAALRRLVDAEPLPAPATHSDGFGIYVLARIAMSEVEVGTLLYIDDLTTDRHNGNAWRVLSMTRDVMADGELHRGLFLAAVCDAEGTPLVTQMSYGAPEGAPAFTCRVEMQDVEADGDTEGEEM